MRPTKRMVTAVMLALACLSGVAAYAKPTFVPMDELIPEELRMSVRAKKKAKAKYGTVSELGPNRERTLAGRDSPVKMQFGSTCTTFGLVAAMENLAGGQTTALSERHLWSQYGVYYTTPALEAAKRTLIVDERYWPQRQAARPVRLPRGILRLKDAPYLGDSISNILNSIDRGYPVYFASEVLKDFGDCKGTVNPLSPVLRGMGHAYEVVGYKVDSAVRGGGYLLVKNSWGTNCGNQGYQWMPFTICTRNDTTCYAWSIRSVASI